MGIQWLKDTASAATEHMHTKRISCFYNQWHRLECHRRHDNNNSEDFFQTTGIWILVGFLAFFVVLASLGVVCCLAMRARPSGGSSYNRGGGGGGGGGTFGGMFGGSRGGGYAGNNRYDDRYRGDRYGGGHRDRGMDDAPPPSGFYATGDNVYPKGEREREREREIVREEHAR